MVGKTYLPKNKSDDKKAYFAEHKFVYQTKELRFSRSIFLAIDVIINNLFENLPAIY